MSPSSSRSRVLIAGGGIAALEGLLAVRDLTDGGAEVTLLSPEREFIYRPLLVLEPFAAPTAVPHEWHREVMPASKPGSDEVA